MRKFVLWADLFQSVQWVGKKKRRIPNLHRSTLWLKNTILCPLSYFRHLCFQLAWGGGAQTIILPIKLKAKCSKDGGSWEVWAWRSTIAFDRPHMLVELKAKGQMLAGIIRGSDFIKEFASCQGTDNALTAITVLSIALGKTSRALWAWSGFSLLI